MSEQQEQSLEERWNATEAAPPEPLPEPEPELKLTKDQQAAVDAVEEWALDPNGPQVKTLGGYAGTGKTECIKRIIRNLDSKLIVDVCAFTGKAVSVLKNKDVYRAKTLHSLMYQPEWEGDRVVGFKLASFIAPDLVIVDEASMVNAQLDKDLRGFNKKILYVGDMGQLEPIGDDPNLMYRPDLVITQIHRQAAESPIIAFAHILRNGLEYTYGSLPGLQIVPASHYEQYIYDCDQIICGFNNTRHALNQMLREKLGFKDQLVVGDRLICLKNNLKFGVYNGLLVKVLAVTESKFCRHSWVCDLEDELGNVLCDIRVYKDQLGKNKLDAFPKLDRVTFWDYGYAITAHKAQGSEWKSVVVIEQTIEKWDRRRWSYTAVTRASEKLVFCRQ